MVDAIDPDGTLPPEQLNADRRHLTLRRCADGMYAGEFRPTGSVGAKATALLQPLSRPGEAGLRHDLGGALIPAAEVLRLAQQADVVPAVMNHAGSVLTLGRTRRIASAAQTQALIARDHGCSFPGCDRPPEWCERHHIRDWIEGALTDLDTSHWCVGTTITTSPDGGGVVG